MKWVCTKFWRMITEGTVVTILPNPNDDTLYLITPEDTQRTRIANFTTIKAHFRKVEE
jgi:hypothetical protein